MKVHIFIGIIYKDLGVLIYFLAPLCCLSDPAPINMEATNELLETTSEAMV